jgi:hypothetical protein
MYKGKYLKKFSISPKRYKELCGFCEQYPEWKEEIKNYSFTKGIAYTQELKSITNNISNPTEEAAMRLSERLSNCELIERVAKEAEPEFWMAIIKSACYEVSVTYLIGFEDLPLSKSAFYNRRRYFFYLLDREKGKR